MVAGGLTGAGGGSIAGSTPPPLQKQSDGDALISYANAGAPKPNAPKPDGGGDKAGADREAGSAGDGFAQSDEQSQKLQDFDAVRGRPSGFEGDRDPSAGRGDVRLAQASIGTMNDASPEILGGGSGSTGIQLEPAEQSDGGMIQGAGKIIKKGAKVGGAAAGMVLGSKGAGEQEILTVPDRPQYRISGQGPEQSRVLERENADGTWTKIGDARVTTDQNGDTTLDGVWMDEGFKPVDLGDTKVPVFPADGPKIPTTLSTPDESGKVDSGPLVTPNDGPRGADVTSTPIPEEQGPQVLEASMKGVLKKHDLPTGGQIRFVPDPDKTPEQVERDRGPNHGFVDRFGNEWVKGPSRTPDHTFEWDVQLSPMGKNRLGWASKDGQHVNVTPDGKISH